MIAVFLTLLLATHESHVPQKIDIRWVYVTDNLAWESPPKDLQKTYVEASATLIIFYPTGDFAFLTCTLFRDRGSNRLSICRGCGFSISKGTWTRDSHNSVMTKSRVVYRNLPIIGEPVPGPELEEHWITRGQPKGRIAADVRSGVGKYVALSNLANLDFLSNIIRS